MDSRRRMMALGPMGGGGLPYATLFRDDFTDDQAAGSLNATPSSDGRDTRTAADTDSKMSNTGGAMVCTGAKTPAAWGNPGLRYGARTRLAGLCLKMAYTPTNAPANGGAIGWTTSAANNNAAMTNTGVRVQDAGQYQIEVFNGSVLMNIGTMTQNVSHDFAFILRNIGAYLLMKGGPKTSEAYTLLYPTNTGNDATQYPAFCDYNAAGSFDSVEVDQMKGTRWTQANGIATQVRATAAPGDQIAHEGDATVEFTWTAVTNEVLEISFRYADANNRWVVRCSQSGSTIKLIQIEGGVETERDSKAQTLTNGVAYRIVIWLDTKNIVTIVNDARKNSFTTTKTLFATGYRIATVDKAGTNFISWPRTLTLNSGTAYEVLDGNRFYSPNAAAALTTPTYDTSGQATHPSVFDAGAGNTWNGYRYWMALTPYPASDQTLENPSILASADGDAWEVPAGLTNPVVAVVPGGTNSDPELVMVGSTLYLINRKVHDTHNYIQETHSTDGVNWSAVVDIITVGLNELVSPAIVYDGSQYVMYSVNSTTTPKQMERRTASTIAGTWSDPEVLVLQITGRTLWHQGACLDANKTYLALNTVDGTMAFAVSVDGGHTWRVSDDLMVPAVGGPDASALYRPTIIKTATGFDMWYGARASTSPDVWHICRTKIYAA